MKIAEPVYTLEDRMRMLGDLDTGPIYQWLVREGQRNPRRRRIVPAIVIEQLEKLEETGREPEQ